LATDFGGAMNDIMSFALGIVLLCGAWFRWPWLVDPPSEWYPYYSQAILKKHFGVRAVVCFTYFLGTAFFAVGSIGIYLRLTP
jgi:hypothetical protein